MGENSRGSFRYCSFASKQVRGMSPGHLSSGCVLGASKQQETQRANPELDGGVIYLNWLGNALRPPRGKKHYQRKRERLWGVVAPAILFQISE